MIGSILLSGFGGFRIFLLFQIREFVEVVMSVIPAKQLLALCFLILGLSLESL